MRREIKNGIYTDFDDSGNVIAFGMYVSPENKKAWEDERLRAKKERENFLAIPRPFKPEWMTEECYDNLVAFTDNPDDRDRFMESIDEMLRDYLMDHGHWH